MTEDQACVVAPKDDAAGAFPYTWQTQTACVGQSRALARWKANVFGTFGLLSRFDSTIPPNGSAKPWDGVDLTPYHRIIASDLRHPNIWRGFRAINLTAGHPFPL